MKSKEKKARKAAAESLPVRGAWVEIGYEVLERRQDKSLPVRGAWVEISNRCSH